MIRLLLGLSLLFAAASEASEGAPLIGRPYGVPSRPYLRAHGTVTEKVEIYMGVTTTALLMRATLITPGFLDAMAWEHARLLGPALRDPNRVVEEMRLDRAGVIEVVFTADSSLPWGESFTGDDRGWNLVMEADGVEQPLVSVDRIREPTPLQYTLFPQMTVWSELWVARFQRTLADPEVIELHVGSGYGHGTLTWRHTNRQEQRLRRAFRALKDEEIP